MDFVLSRKDYREDGIFGELKSESNFFVTLEHSYSNVPKLPPGKYTCKKGIHTLHDGIPFTAFEVMDVPGHTGILFHVGNYNADSEGCLLLGLQIGRQLSGGWMITHSKQAFEQFMKLQENVDEFNLTVETEG